MTPEAVFDGFAAALDEALDEPAVVYGNSLGGAMAAQYALERAARTQGLILASPAGARLSEEALAALLSGFDFADRAAVLGFLARLNPKVTLGARLIASDVRANFARPAVRALVANIRTEHHIAPERLATLAMPTLLLWGRLDGLLPAEMREYYRAHLPAHAAFEEPDHVGHCPQSDRPRWTAGRILRFTHGLRGAG
jgi:pimeloyl-ACP methyl ester carboxylesterase